MHFTRKPEILVNLKHKNIIRVKDFGIKDDTPYLEMKYASNGTLLEAYPLDKTSSSPEKPLSPMEVFTLALPIGDALQYMHSMNRVHLDLKQANVLIEADNELKLSDFGLAQIFHSTASLRRSELRQWLVPVHTRTLITSILECLIPRTISMRLG